MLLSLKEFQNYWIFVSPEDFLSRKDITFFYKTKKSDSKYIRVCATYEDKQVLYALSLFDRDDEPKYIEDLAEEYTEYCLTEEQAKICFRQWGGNALDYNIKWISYTGNDFPKGYQDNSFRHVDRYRTINLYRDIQVMSLYCSYHKRVEYDIYVIDPGKSYSDFFVTDLSEKEARIILQDWGAFVDFVQQPYETIKKGIPLDIGQTEVRRKEDIMSDLENALYLLEKKSIKLGYNSEDNSENDDLIIGIDSLKESIVHLFEEIGEI